jgi:hypothetical protein
LKSYFGTLSDDLVTSVGVDEVVRHVLSAHVHVRHHLDEIHVGQKLQVERRALVVRVVRRDREVRPSADDAVRHPAFFGRGFGDGEADERPIDHLLADGGVVDLERNVAVRRNELPGLEGTVIVRRTARHIAVEPARAVRAGREGGGVGAGPADAGREGASALIAAPSPSRGDSFHVIS